jgi:hypothetical protein
MMRSLLFPNFYNDDITDKNTKPSNFDIIRLNFIYLILYLNIFY